MLMTFGQFSYCFNTKTVCNTNMLPFKIPLQHELLWCNSIIILQKCKECTCPNTACHVRHTVTVISIDLFLFLFCFYRLKWVSILGTKYKTGCTLQIDTDQYDNPVFGQVLKICIVDGNFSDICFVVSKLTTTQFDSHYQSFEVQTIHPRRKLIVHHTDLASFLPLNQVKPYGVVTRNKYIVQRFDIGTIN